jgi:CRISPR-associated protein Csm4
MTARLVTYSVRWRGATGTPLRGDTLWGEVCWALRETAGEAHLTRLLEQMQAPDGRPFALSDAMPEGLLPRPVMPPLPRREREALLPPDTPPLRGLQRLKKARKVRLIPADWLRARAATGLTERDITAECLRVSDGTRAPVPALIEDPRTHVTINRQTGRALEGALFMDSASWSSPPDAPWHIVADPGLLGEPALTEALRYVGLTGHGADASTGMGKFDIEPPRPFDWPDIPEPNAALALGSFCPAPADPARGWWRLETRFGRVGNIYSCRDINGVRPTPFKKPLVMLQPGSLLGPATAAGCWRLGRLVAGIHALPQVVHGAITPALPVRVTDPRWPTEV